MESAITKSEEKGPPDRDIHRGLFVSPLQIQTWEL